MVVGLALAVVALGMPGMASAETPSFHALSKVTAAQPMTDGKLSKVEGAWGHRVCIVCVNAAVVLQGNLNLVGFEVFQSNDSRIQQSIN